MRIAVLTENFLPKIDGVTHTLIRMLDHLQAHGHEAMVFGPQGSPRRYGRVAVVPIPGVRLPMYPELRVLAPWRIPATKLAAFDPDIIHLCDPMLLGPAGLHWARRLNVPVVAAYHTNLAQYMRYFGLGYLGPGVWTYRRYIHNRCAMTLCPSRSTQAALVAQGFSRVRVWPHGVDTALFAPSRRDEARRRQLGADEGTRLLLYVGRLSHEKNVRLLAEAYRAVARPGVRLVVVGDGPARREMEELLQGLPATFTGYLRGESLAATFACADLFLFPSTTETFGLVVQEAMASGLPVIGCRAGGVADLVRDGVTGLLARPNDVRSFALAVEALLRDPARRAAMGEAARAEVSKRRWEDVMDLLLAYYQQAVRARLGADGGGHTRRLRRRRPRLPRRRVAGLRTRFHLRRRFHLDRVNTNA